MAPLVPLYIFCSNTSYLYYMERIDMVTWSILPYKIFYDFTFFYVKLKTRDSFVVEITLVKLCLTGWGSFKSSLVDPLCVQLR